MMDLALNTPRHKVDLSLTQEQREAALKAVEYFLNELDLGISICGSDELINHMREVQTALREAI